MRIIMGLLLLAVAGSVASSSRGLLEPVEPDIFAYLERASVPDSFTLIGISTRAGVAMTAYSTTDSPETAMATWLAQFSQSGWRRGDNSAFVRRGFQAIYQPLVETVCGPKVSYRLSIERKDGRNIAFVADATDFVSGDINACDALENPDFRRSVSMKMFLPVLQVPEGVYRSGRNSIVGRTFTDVAAVSGQSNATTRTSFTAEQSLEQLASFFGNQIVEQGWQLDSQWAGEIAAGSVWRRTAVAEGELMGKLDILQSAQQGFRVSFVASQR